MVEGQCRWCRQAACELHTTVGMDHAVEIFGLKLMHELQCKQFLQHLVMSKWANMLDDVQFQINNCLQTDTQCLACLLVQW